MNVTLKVVVEKQAKEYVAYPLGGVDGIAGHGSTHEEALADLRFSIESNVQEYGSEVLSGAREVLDAFVDEMEIELP
jgi:hypothetical protein